MIYQWKDGARQQGDAQKVGNEVEKIRVKKGGYIEPGDLVEFGRNPKSELHGLFEWDDMVAAEKYRIVQAGDIIRCITVQSEDEGDEEFAVRYLASIIVEDENGSKKRKYVSTFEALEDGDMRQQVLGDILAAIQEAQDKLRLLQRIIKKSE